MTRVYGPLWPWLLALYFALAVVCGYHSWSRVVLEGDRAWSNQDSVDVVVSTLSDTPLYTARWASVRSRVLVPLIVVGAHDYLGIPYRLAHDGSRLFFIFAALLAMHWLLRTWFTPLEALVGTLLVIATITITFNSTIPQVTDFPELLGMTAAAGLLVRGRWRWMLLVFAVATLNRETSVILGAVVLCVLYDVRLPWRSQWRTVGVPCAVVAATWWLAHSLARAIAGVKGEWLVPPEGTGHGQGLAAEFLGTFWDTWPRRVDSMMSLVYNPHPYNANWSMFLLLNVFWILPLWYWRSIPAMLRRLYVGGLVGALPIFAFVGVLNEAGRHMIPLYPLVMPAGLFALVRFVVPPNAVAASIDEARVSMSL